MFSRKTHLNICSSSKAKKVEKKFAIGVGWNAFWKLTHVELIVFILDLQNKLIFSKIKLQFLHQKGDIGIFWIIIIISLKLQHINIEDFNS